MDMIELLIQYGADLRAVDNITYVASSDIEIIRYFLSRGTSATRIGINGFPPIVFVARGDKGEHPERVQLLLEFGAAVNAPGPKGKTALHYAAAAGHLKTMTVLLDNGADPRLKDVQGNTALDLARSAGKSHAVTLLLERGAKR
jgi:ankyrin repeat protein